MSGKEASQHDEPVRRFALRSEGEKTAEIGDDHVAHRPRPPLDVEQIAGEKRVMPRGGRNAQDHFVCGKACNGRELLKRNHRVSPSLAPKAAPCFLLFCGQARNENSNFD
jgi:hypothetical protein